MVPESERVPLNLAGVTKILDEAEAVGRDTDTLRERIARYQACYVQGKSLAQPRQWLVSSVAKVGVESRREKDRLEAVIKTWSSAADNDRRLRHYVRGAGRIRRSVAQGHTIHWQLGRYRRWVTLLGLEISSTPMMTTDESASSSLRVVPTAGS